MKKCYIAGKIGDLPIEVYTSIFEKGKAEVIAMGYEPVSPIELPHKHGRTWSEYMKEDLIAMLGCDCVYALRNWRQSPGASIEVQTAVSIGIDVIHQRPLPVVEVASVVPAQA